MSTLVNLLRTSRRGAKGPTGLRQHQAMEAALRERLGDEAVNDALVLVTPRRLTLEVCKESAQPHQSRVAWEKADGSAYTTARVNGWLDQCCGHMVRMLQSWTLDKCMASALQYESRAAWKKATSRAYQAARRNGWLDKCCAHMVRMLQSWPLEKCKESARDYQSRAAWKKADANAYAAACANGWLDKCCAHMVLVRRRNWTLEECKESARTYRMRVDWEKGACGAFQAAQRNGWLDKCCAHMVKYRRPPLWSLEKCTASAKRFKGRKAWYVGDQNAYNAACRKGWLEECCAHMGTPMSNVRSKPTRPTLTSNQFKALLAEVFADMPHQSAALLREARARI